MKNSSKVILALLAVAAVALIASFVFANLGNDSESAEAPADVNTADSKEYVMPEEEMVLEDDPTTADYDNGIYFDEEGEDVEVETKNASESDFIGAWEATSGQAAYLYGNVELTIETNGTWKGNITEEPLKGRWQKRGEGIYLTSEIFNCTLTFSKDGTLMMQEDYNDDSGDEASIIVLTRK